MQPIKLKSAKFLDVVLLGKGLGDDNFDFDALENSDKKARAWFVGTGIVVEVEGLPDKFIGLNTIRQLEAAERTTPWQWAGVEGPKEEPKAEAKPEPKPAKKAEAKPSEKSSKTSPKKQPEKPSKKRGVVASALGRFPSGTSKSSSAGPKDSA